MKRLLNLKYTKLLIKMKPMLMKLTSIIVSDEIKLYILMITQKKFSWVMEFFWRIQKQKYTLRGWFTLVGQTVQKRNKTAQRLIRNPHI